jgi:prepilin-type N-terminal cleavage/methylation domain-containing protein
VNARKRRQSGLSLIELLVGVLIVGLLVLVAAPSFSRFITVQRLRSISAALVTDIQFVRAEAASRNVKVALKFDNTGSAMTCYVVLTGDVSLCDCNQTPGSTVCTGSAQREIRTVQVQRGLGITLGIPSAQTVSALRFDPATGRVEVASLDVFSPPTGPFKIEVSNPDVGSLVTAIEVTGRPSTCSPGGQISGVPACS